MERAMQVVEGRVFRGGALRREALGIEDGRIVAVGPRLRADQGRRDFGDRLILPGAIDAHVHLREPGMVQKEDFRTGTLAAAFGGVTTVLDMPNTIPPVVDLRRLSEKWKLVSGRANVDYGFHVGLVPGGDASRTEGLATAYKVYMAETTGGLDAGEYSRLGELIAPAARAGKVVVFHAEDRALIHPGPAADLKGHLRCRPAAAEASAIRTLLDLRRARIHVAHVSSREGLDALGGADLTAEVTPHHLLLDISSDLGALGKVNPPLRTREDREALLRAFAAGRIPLLASDHAPHTLEEKAEFEGAPAGMPGVETMVPLLMALVRRGHLPLERLIDAFAPRPAAVFGLEGKGRLEVGMDADLMVVDPSRGQRIRGDDLHSRCGWTAFEGWEAISPQFVMLRGEPIVEEGEVVAEGSGRLVAPRGVEGRGQATA